MKIHEEILRQMQFMGVNQAMICFTLNMQVQNFNSFIRGKRSMPVEDLIKVMDLLSITFGHSEDNFSNRHASEVRDIISIKIKELGCTIKAISDASGVSESSISRFISNKSGCSTNTLEKILTALKFTIISYEIEEDTK